MRAAVLTAPRTVDVHDVELERAQGDAVVRVVACGVCGSDQNAWRGVQGIGYPLQPGAPGHEVYGEVLDAGGDPSLRVGMRVTGLVQNAYAEQAAARPGELVEVPSSLGDALFLGEPVACAANVVRRMGSAPRVAVVGFGFLAALIAQLGLRSCDWTAVSQRAASRELALRHGASAAYALDEVPAALWDSFPIVIEAAGTQRTLELATWLVATGGRLVIAGYHADGARQVDLRTWNWKGIDVINAHERAAEAYLRGLRDGLAAAERGTLELAPLISHRYALDELALALDAAERRPADYIKGVVLP